MSAISAAKGLTYDEVVNYCGGASIPVDRFVLKCSELFAAEDLGLLTISPDAKLQLNRRISL